MKKLPPIFLPGYGPVGLISFVATFLLIFIPSMISYLFPEPASQRYFLFVSRIWMNIWLTLVGCPLRIRGKQHFKRGSVCGFITITRCSMCPYPALMFPGPIKPLPNPHLPGSPCSAGFMPKARYWLTGRMSAAEPGVSIP